ncbi:formate dehydrogenase subunit gamma [Shewanella algidipiscicola]|uniref:Formate dehydrogenase subunit gamma n=1 Tax=Shewanella algidipiscicola TaxID=614070 RepID=A0ABQ4PJX8_9GAMM|nr:formate dehydrogenase subunit gamma [Shewanella algidipiscicola]GIU48136.1 formate dehydrogenase subunit gamma [Shewanella algidipiscicola]
MKMITAVIAGVMAFMCSFHLLAADTLIPEPQQWQPIQIEVVQGDIPELRGMPLQAQFPAPQPSVNQEYIEILSPASFWADLLNYGFFGMIALLALFVVINGKAKLNQGFSGKKVDRWSGMDVLVHWVGAIACLALVITGLIMTAGRFWLAPNMGAYQWFGFIDTSVALHNLMAFPFMLGWAVMVIKWAKKQLPEACDIGWLKAVGGYLNFGPFKGKHPDAGFANAGEKLWFWCFTLFGALMVGSGLILMFPSLVATKDGANLALILHLVSAFVLGAFTVVHIYMATVISEGGMECMLSGQCDENWAKQHHNLWFNELKKSSKV